MKKTNRIEILENGVIQVRELEMLELADGSFIEGGYSRYTIAPNVNIETITDVKVKNVAVATFTDEVINAYNESIKQDNI
ncbi:MAG: hypothetical protein JJV88_00530 [Sulfurovum sp.]|nr:hypothetical protein [Sulfurovaceae bacterium]